MVMRREAARLQKMIVVVVEAAESEQMGVRSSHKQKSQWMFVVRRVHTWRTFSLEYERLSAGEYIKVDMVYW